MSSKILVIGGNGALGVKVINKLIANNVETVVHYFGKKLRVKNIKHIKIDFNKDTVDFSNYFEEPNSFDGIVFTHTYYYSEPITDISKKNLKKSFKVNYLSPLLLLNYFINSWKQNPSKLRSVVYINTVATKTVSPNEIGYFTMKSAFEVALNSYTRAYSNDTFKIRFNSISPGMMDTPVALNALKERPDVLERIPMKKLTPSDEVANLVFDILFNYPSIVGQNIHINNGRWTGN